MIPHFAPDKFVFGTLGKVTQVSVKIDGLSRQVEQCVTNSTSIEATKLRPAPVGHYPR